MLRWNPTDVLTCLGVPPETEDQDLSHGYSVTKLALRLDLTIFQHEGDVYITISSEGANDPVIDFQLRGCDACRWVNDERGSYLEFASGQLFGGRYDGASAIPHGVRVRVDPSIRLEFFSAPT